MKRSFSFGFTLVELLVVIAVLGVLGAGLIVAINPLSMLQRGWDSRRKADLRNIQEALTHYSIDNGGYPPTVSNGWVYSTAAGNSWIPGLSSYMKTVPKDPKNNGNGPWGGGARSHSYAYRSNGIHYNLVALLENPNDSDRCELKKWVYITNFTTGAGLPWCGGSPGYSYSLRLYSRNSMGNN